MQPMSEKALTSQSDTIAGTAENTGRDPGSLTEVETMRKWEYGKCLRRLWDAVRLFQVTSFCVLLASTRSREEEIRSSPSE